MKTDRMHRRVGVPGKMHNRCLYVYVSVVCMVSVCCMYSKYVCMYSKMHTSLLVCIARCIIDVCMFRVQASCAAILRPLFKTGLYLAVYSVPLASYVYFTAW